MPRPRRMGGGGYFYNAQEQWGSTQRTLEICEQGIAGARIPEHGGSIARYRAAGAPLRASSICVVCSAPARVAVTLRAAPCVSCGFVISPKPYGGYLYIVFRAGLFSIFEGVVANFMRICALLGNLHVGIIDAISSSSACRIKMRNIPLEV